MNNLPDEEFKEKSSKKRVHLNSQFRKKLFLDRSQPFLPTASHQNSCHDANLGM